VTDKVKMCYWSD